MPPRVTPWSDTIDVTVDAEIAVEVHLGTDPDFVPSSATYQGTLYAPGTLHVTGAAPGIDHYARLASLGREEVSDPSEPVQTTGGS
jgi:hypothetical protein